eukprot:Skav216804  [mRNA]  locus=scaffold2110:106192:106779:- [translate_table: standard]
MPRLGARETIQVSNATDDVIRVRLSHNKPRPIRRKNSQGGAAGVGAMGANVSMEYEEDLENESVTEGFSTVLSYHLWDEELSWHSENYLSITNADGTDSIMGNRLVETARSWIVISDPDTGKKAAIDAPDPSKPFRDSKRRYRNKMGCPTCGLKLPEPCTCPQTPKESEGRGLCSFFFGSNTCCTSRAGSPSRRS